MTYWADRYERNEIHEAERQECRSAIAAMTEMERAHFDEEMHH